MKKQLKLNSGWSYCTEQILQFERELSKSDSINIIEFGAGDSSAKIYEYFLQKYKNIKYTCYETDAKWVPKHKHIEPIIYENVREIVLREEIYDLVLVDGPTGIDRKFWYEKLRSVTKTGTIIHIDDYDHYKEFEEELVKNLNFDELYRKSRKVKGEKSWLTVKIS